MAKRAYKTIPLDGKLVTSVDPLLLNNNDFSVLENFRYINSGVNGIRPLGGMTKINTTATTNAKMRSGIHFKKDYPAAESHVLVQAINSGSTDSAIYDNQTAIPGTGDFDATAVASSLGTNVGRFNLLPDGCVGFWNRNKSYVWAGTETRVGTFVSFNTAAGWLYDYTEQINNSQTDATNLATIRSAAGAGDTYTKALWHFDNAVTDASSGAHTLTNNGTATFTTTNAPYGTHWAALNGSTQYFSVADHADFDLSGGVFTIDATINASSLAAANPIYSQRTDANNYFEFGVTTSGALYASIAVAGIERLTNTVISSAAAITAGTTYKVRVVQNGDIWRLFINGTMVKEVTNTGVRCANYTGAVEIGRTNLASPTYFTGNIDEVRVSNSARSTASYTVMTQPFGLIAYLHVGSARPIKGIKFYMQTVNNTESSVSVSYYNSVGTATAVSSLVDNTTTTGASLAKTGTVTFTDTNGLAYPTINYGIMNYWYLVTFENLNNITYPQIYQATLLTSMQTFKDIWDGIPLPISQFWQYTHDGKYKDYTTNVAKKDVTVAYNGYNFANMSSTFYKAGGKMVDSSDFIFVGTETRASGFRFIIPTDDDTATPSYSNTKASTMTIYYWSGATWVSLGTITDGTLDDGGTKTLNNTGTATFCPATADVEYKTSIADNDVYQYYYKIVFSDGVSANCGIDEITYIPVPVDVDSFGYGFEWRNRTVLLDEINGKRDRILIGSEGSTGTFNGEDSYDGNVGDGMRLVAGGSLYHHSSEGIYVYGILCSLTRTHVITGSGPADLKILPISEKYGCVAPNTFEVCIVRVSDKEVKNVAIWRSATGMVACDGTSVYPISDDIADLYDPHKSTVITSSTIGGEYGRFDLQYGAYHYFYANASATTINKEQLYDPKKDGWSSAVRTPVLMGIIPVSDTSGNQYSYGFTDTGYLERLEYGNTYDTTAITYKLRTADSPIVTDQAFNLAYRSTINWLRILCAKNTSADVVTLKYYGDTVTTATTLDQTVAQTSTTSRVKISAPISVKDTTAHFTHSFELSAVMDDISTGFEPLGIVVGYTMDDSPDTGR